MTTKYSTTAKRGDEATPSPTTSSPTGSIYEHRFEPTKRFYISFWTISFIFLLSAFESSVVGNVLPTISSALNLGNAYIWGSVAFLLSSAIIQPFYAQLQDALGRKAPLLGAITVFGIGSLCCGFANGPASFITGRVIQGLGTSGIDLIGETIVGDLVPLRFRPKWFGIKQAVYAFGTLLGPVLGGVFTQDVTWRCVFWLNVPLCVVSGLLITFALKLQQPCDGGWKERFSNMKEMDMVGISLIGFALAMGTISLSDGHALGNPTSRFLFATSIILLLAFTFWETFAIRTSSLSHHSQTFLSPHLWRRPRTSLIGLFNILTWGAIAYGTQLILPMHLQAVIGREPIKAGWDMLPITALLVFFSWFSGWMLSRLGRLSGIYKWMQLGGFALTALGTGVMICLNASVGDEVLFSSMVTAAMGSGISIPAILPSVVVELGDADNAAATGNWAFLRTVGAIVGCLLPALSLNYETREALQKITDRDTRTQLAENGIWDKASADFMKKLPGADQEIVRDIFTSGLRTSFIAFTIFAVVSTFLTLLMKSVRMREHNDTRFGLDSRRSSNSTVVAEEGDNADAR